jgi:SAM-dependent methyltransferase
MNYLVYFLKETWHKRTIYRVLFQWELIKNKVLFDNKEVLHIASGGNPTYGDYIYPCAKKIIKTDYIKKPGVDQILDFNMNFPFENEMFDVVILCNALYIANDPSFTLSEIARILRPNGTYILVNPFVANEMPQPHDFGRLTKEGIRKLTTPLFKEIALKGIGERGTSALYVLQPFVRFWIIRMIFYPIAIFIDHLIPRNVKRHHPFPLGYIYVGRK